MREKNGGNIDSSCFVGRKFLRKIRWRRKRKFVVIIWGRWKNRGKERGIRAVFAPRQAVYSSKLYLVFPVSATLPYTLPQLPYHTMPVSCTLCMRLANSINSLPCLPNPNSANQSSNLSQLSFTNQSTIFYSLAIFHFIVWQSKIINHTFTQDVEKLINQPNHLLSQSLCRFAPVLRDSGVVKK